LPLKWIDIIGKSQLQRIKDNPEEIIILKTIFDNRPVLYLILSQELGEEINDCLKLSIKNKKDFLFISIDNFLVINSRKKVLNAT